jgi:hypothetical protein
MSHPLRAVLLVCVVVSVSCANQHAGNSGSSAAGKGGADVATAGQNTIEPDAGVTGRGDAAAQPECANMTMPSQPVSWPCVHVECKWDESSSTWVGNSCGACPIVKDPKPDMAAGECDAGAPDCWTNQLGRFACKDGIYKFYIVVPP